MDNSGENSDVTRMRIFNHEPTNPISFDIAKLELRKVQALKKGAGQFQWLCGKLFPHFRTALIDTTLLAGIAIVEFAMHVMEQRDSEIRIWAINEWEWWAGFDLEGTKLEFAKSHGFDNIAQATTAGVYGDCHELTDAELDTLTYCTDLANFPESETMTFRERLAQIIHEGVASAELPAMFASTEC